VCGGIEYLNVGTLEVLAVVMIGLAGRTRRGSETFPKTLLSPRNDVAIVWVGPIWVVRPVGSHMAMWSMHEVWSGFDGGRNVGVVGPSHLS
jgi:hypothetical protein